MPQTLRQPLAQNPGGLITYGVHHPERRQVERFIQAVYSRRFQARVNAFAPTLVGLHDPEGHLVAAAGYRPADAGPLFLERYLHRPVQQLLRGPDAPPQARQGIVEVGHLAASRPGEGRRLIRLLGPWLAEAGVDWVVSTTTQELRHLFGRMGIVPLALGPADPSLLGEAARDWGRYYDHQPVVVAGQMPHVLKALTRHGSVQ